MLYVVGKDNYQFTTGKIQAHTYTKLTLLARWHKQLIYIQ